MCVSCVCVCVSLICFIGQYVQFSARPYEFSFEYCSKIGHVCVLACEWMKECVNVYCVDSSEYYIDIYKNRCESH